MKISRRDALIGSLAGVAPLSAQLTRAEFQIERWGMFEQALQATVSGNPFTDVTFSVQFRFGNRTVDTQGFYDGADNWRFRFSPDAEGQWTWTTRSNIKALDGQTGRFTCSAPTGNNHGPVVVRNTSHFAYADGTKYFPFGTTCYAWNHQSEELEQQTLDTLRTAGFNKMRMCVFPKWYTYNHGEPPRHPFERNAKGESDYTRFNPAFFQHLEMRVWQLAQMGIEADLILFHPYDNWGYQKMPAEVDDRYLRYVTARLAAYRNVWWSMANEWDLMKFKALADFDRYFRIVQENDPYQRLRSVHHSKVMYDHGKPWATHASIQDDDFSKTQLWLDTFRKPIVYDECKYEGNIPQRWGNISAQEMTRRFWLAVTGGAYAGHGETYLNTEGFHNEGVLWWSKGGKLRGDSAPRVAFLRKLLEEGPVGGLTPLPNPYYAGAAKAGAYYLYYLDYHQPVEADFVLPDGVKFQAEVIDPWKMTAEPVAGTVTGKTKLKLPGAPYLAVRFRRIA